MRPAHTQQLGICSFHCSHHFHFPLLYVACVGRQSGRGPGLRRGRRENSYDEGIPSIVLVITGFAGFFTAVIPLARYILKEHVQKGHNEVLAPIFLTAGTIYAVLLAFVVIAVWEAYDAANANTSEEASTLATMYRQTAGMPRDEQREMRRLLREYTDAVVAQEWQIQAKTGGASPAARHLIAEIYRVFGKLAPAEAAAPISVEFLRTFSIVAADRNRRTLEAEERLPRILWFVLLLGAAIVIGMTFFLYMEVFSLHYVLSAAMAIMIGMLLIMTYLLDRPFTGPLAVDASSFEHSLGVYNSVHAGN